MTKKERRQLGRAEPKFQNGGFRAGKRKRGNSPLRKIPKTQASVQRFDIVDNNGMTVVSDASLISYRRERG